MVSASLDGRLAVVDAAGARVAWRRTASELRGAQWTADGAAVAWWDVDGRAGLTEDGGRALAQTDADVVDLAVAPAGAEAIVATRAGALLTLTAAGVRTRASDLGPLARVAVGSRSIAIGRADGVVALVEPGGVVEVGDGPAAIERLAFSPDGTHLLASSGGGPTQAYVVDARARVAEVDGVGLAWSPDGRRFATALADGRVVVRDLRGAMTTLNGHTRPALAAAFTADGAALVTAGLDGAVIVWELARGEIRLRYAGALAATALAITPDGATAVVGYEGGPLRTWPITTAGALARACAMLAAFGHAASTARACQ